jgi:hypothetical protein
MTNLFSVCAFFAALLLLTFRKATTDIRVSVGVASGIVAILITWCIVNFWDLGIADWEGDDTGIVSED